MMPSHTPRTLGNTRYGTAFAGVEIGRQALLVGVYRELDDGMPRSSFYTVIETMNGSPKRIAPFRINSDRGRLFPSTLTRQSAFVLAVRREGLHGHGLLEVVEPDVTIIESRQGELSSHPVKLQLSFVGETITVSEVPATKNAHKESMNMLITGTHQVNPMFQVGGLSVSPAESENLSLDTPGCRLMTVTEAAAPAAADTV